MAFLGTPGQALRHLHDAAQRVACGDTPRTSASEVASPIDDHTAKAHDVRRCEAAPLAAASCISWRQRVDRLDTQVRSQRLAGLLRHGLARGP